MKRIILTMIMAAVMTTSISAQRISNTTIEARFLTNKMVDELGLNSWQREKAYQMNLNYLNSINSYKDIDAGIWKMRNQELKNILTVNQWNAYKSTSYFYRPISWRKGTYVKNIYARYPNAGQSFGNHRSKKQVAITAPGSSGPQKIDKQHQPNYTAYNKNDSRWLNTNSTESPKRSFGSMRR